MKMTADTFEAFFENAGQHKEVLLQLDQMILRLAPDIDRKLYNSPTLCGIGYAAMPYKGNKTFGGIWPIIGLAPQKHTANLYVMAPSDSGPSLVETYAGKLGKVSQGKSCIRIKKMEDVNTSALEELLAEALRWFRSKQPSVPS